MLCHYIFPKTLKKHRTSETNIIEATPEESAAAKARLDKVHKKRM
jgi:hypothetical protein